MVNVALGAVSRFAASRFGVFTSSEAAAQGISPAGLTRLRKAGVIRQPTRGVWVMTAVPDCWAQRIVIAHLGALVPIWFSHRTAARLQGLDGFATEESIDITCTPEHRLCRPGVDVHLINRLEPRDLERIDGLPVTTIPATLAMLGSVVPIVSVERAVEDALRKGIPIPTLRETATRLHRTGQFGSRVLLDLLDGSEGRSASGSWFEVLIEKCIAAPGLPELVRQYEIRDHRGRFVARPDLAFPSLRLGVECHSRTFHSGRRAELRDEARDLAVAALGWQLVYIGWQSHRRPAQVLAQIRSICLARQQQLALAENSRRTASDPSHRAS